jgi:hypothetical protein
MKHSISVLNEYVIYVAGCFEGRLISVEDLAREGEDFYEFLVYMECFSYYRVVKVFQEVHCGLTQFFILGIALLVGKVVKLSGEIEN